LTTQFAPIHIAAPFAINVPFVSLPAPTLTAPFATKKTFTIDAPLIKCIFTPAAKARAPFIWKTNLAFGLFCQSKNKSPAIDAAQD
jgi:hypothetical protein